MVGRGEGGHRDNGGEGIALEPPNYTLTHASIVVAVDEQQARVTA
jgi:hypothetical protein